MPDNTNNELDTDAILAQIAAYRAQRDIAMNDVAILSGQLESLKKKYGKLEAAFIELTKDTETKPQTAEQSGDSAVETIS